MQLLTIGVNHQTAPIALREQVAFVPDEIGQTIARLRQEWADAQHGALTEAAIVSTCNRTELYCAVQAPDAAARALTQFLAQAKNIEHEAIGRATYVLPQSQSVRHAFRVASGLDSMVLGEPQILGQMKEAERLARAAGGLGLMLGTLFQRTFAVAKEVRSRTEIGAQSVSLAAAAVRTAERIFGPLEHSRVLFVGAGEMIELCATHFASRSPQDMVVASRSAARAQALAKRLQGHAIRLADIPEQLAQFDVVVS
ncbi:MAG TPA: glutamyl-tRNA reductase, partial [Burkholderiaceae bacterium]|nr:glutamyl-tRNA reductase [Burkholderiaceae bacterium]